MPIRTEYVDLTVSDATAMRAYVAHPESATHAGLLVGQEAWGVNGHIRDVTERFAREGYLAIAPELYHRTGPGFEGRYDDMPAAMGHARALKEPQMEADLRAAFDWLHAKGNLDGRPVAAVGFCLGGRAAFLADLTLPVACAVSFYGGGIAPGQSGPGLIDRVHDLHAPILFFWAGRDKHIGIEGPRALADALRAKEKSFVSVEFSDADHGFFCDQRASYHPAAAAEAWPLTLAFLRTNTTRHEKARSAD
ncbi:MAG TPA: dienelactone hydrolase family protein [Candidatus Acidoferrales bacterium]|nr:dienelactone hydrolase family protein [Candidatus Acidoferrales bacterium]